MPCMREFVVNERDYASFGLLHVEQRILWHTAARKWRKSQARALQCDQRGNVVWAWISNQSWSDYRIVIPCS